MESAMSRYALSVGAMLLLTPLAGFADSVEAARPLDLTHTWAGYFSLVAVVLAYVFAMFEDVTFLRKSKPMLLGASLVWVAILVVYRQHGDTHPALQAFRDNLLGYMELLLFILVSMTYLNVMEDMKVFDALRLKLVRLNLGYRPLFCLNPC